MGEQLDLSAADQASAGTNHYWLDVTTLDKRGSRATFQLGCTSGISKSVTVTGTSAMDYMKALNKRNATVKSNEKWTIEQLQAAGLLGAGSVSGTPD